MKVSEIMHQAFHIPGETSVMVAAQLMEQKRVDSVLVTHENNVGIFTEHDILHKVVARGLDPAHLKVRDIMTVPVRTIPLDAYVEDASELMNSHNIRRLVVMDNQQIAGIISATCIARNIKYLIARRLMTHQMESSVESTS